MTIDEIKELIKPLYELTKDYCEGMILTGSIILPWINNYHDIDIVSLCKTKEDRGNLVSIYVENKELMKSYYSKGIYPLTCDYELFLNPNKPYAYERKYGVILYAKNNFDISFDIFNDNYLNILKEGFKCVKKEYEDKGIFPKWFYHIITGAYLLENKSYNLTEEQIQNINIVHDAIEQEKIKVLFDFVEGWLKKESYE